MYRDVEYNQQQLQQQQQPQQQQVRGKSTYRPNEQLVTTPLPISVPQPPRDSFNKPILKPKEPQYSNNNNNPPPQQQGHSPFSYSTDYEDSLIPQVSLCALVSLNLKHFHLFMMVGLWGFFLDIIFESRGIIGY